MLVARLNGSLVQGVQKTKVCLAHFRIKDLIPRDILAQKPVEPGFY
jgi:hypothetical protein